MKTEHDGTGLLYAGLYLAMWKAFACRSSNDELWKKIIHLILSVKIFVDTRRTNWQV